MLFFSGLVGALIGGFITLAFNLWKHNREEFEKRCDDLCKIVTDASDLGVSYWSMAFADETAFSIAEAKIEGVQSLIDGTYSDLRGNLRPDDAQNIDLLLSQFTSNLTGGEFSVPNRRPDIQRMRFSPVFSSQFVISVRKANRNAMPINRFRNHVRRNCERVLDMPSTR